MRTRTPLLLLMLVPLLAGCQTREQPSTATPAFDVVKPSLARDAWGSWSAEAGATNVTGPSLLRVEGTEPARVRFLDTAFRGADDPRWSVPIEGNLVMGWGYAQGTFRWTDAESVVVPLSPEARAAFVNYRILEVGEPLFAQTYRAAYVVEAVEAATGSG